MTEFCITAEKKELLVDKNEGTIVQYSTIVDNQRDNCKKVGEMYNTCIDADNLIYPNSNYRKCYSKSNTIYSCNKVERYSDQEKEIVYYIL